MPGLGYQSFYAKYYRTVSRDFFGITNARGTGYLDVGWSIAAAWTRAWGATDAYDRYTTGVPRADGVIAYSNPSRGTFTVSVARNF